MKRKRTTSSQMRPSSTEHPQLEDQAIGYNELTFHSIFHAPIDSPQKILDVGCGTSFVTHDLATAYPSAHVYGLDLSSVPALRPKQPNITFVQGDIRALAVGNERFGPESYDYVFHSLLICGMTDWPGYVRLVASTLRPVGWVAIHDACWDLFKHERRISNGYEWLEEVRKAAERKGLDIHCGKKIGQWMKQAGLVNVEVVEYKTPIRTCEVDCWPEKRKIGEYYETWVMNLYWHLIPKLLGSEKSADDIERFRRQMIQDLQPEGGRYWSFFVTTTKKP